MANDAARCQIWHVVLLTALLAFTACKPRGVEPQSEPAVKSELKPIVQPVVKKPQLHPDLGVAETWKKVGATVGWYVIHPTGLYGVSSATETEPDARPIFGFKKFDNEVLDRLPIPSSPFGLNFSNSDIDDVSLGSLTRFKKLESLNLTQTAVTDEGLADLAPLKQLRAIDLTRTKITGSGLKHLAGLHSVVMLGGTPTDEGMKGIGSLKELQLLRVDYPFRDKITDAGARELVGLDRLRILYLMDARITDAGAAELARMKNLHTLYLTGSPLTDAGLRPFAAQKSLKKLDVSFSRVSNRSAAELRKMRPDLEVVHFGRK